MIKIKIDDVKKLPTLYSIFIILALIPQILGFNGSIVDTLWKMVIMCGFLILKMNLGNMTISRSSIIFIMLYFFNNVITMMLNPNKSISSIFNVILFGLLFLMFYEMPRKDKIIHNGRILNFYKIFAYFIFISCVYNMIKNANTLAHITSNTVYGSQIVCSFFDNKNTFGVFLIFGCLAAMFMYYFSKQKRWLLFIIIFMINELMAMCRTAIILSIIILVVSILVVDNKSKLSRKIISISIIICLLFLIRSNIGIKNYILNNIFGSTTSIEARNTYVDNMIGLLQGVHLIFGYGLSNSSVLAATYTGNQYFHNTYLKVAISGGIFYEILFLGMIMFSLKKSIAVYKCNRAVGGLCVLSLIVYLIYASVESVILFDTPVVAMVATIFVISMPILFNRTNDIKLKNNLKRDIYR